MFGLITRFGESASDEPISSNTPSYRLNRRQIGQAVSLDVEDGSPANTDRLEVLLEDFFEFSRLISDRTFAGELGTPDDEVRDQCYAAKNRIQLICDFTTPPGPSPRVGRGI